MGANSRAAGRILVCLLGLALSAYALFVEHQKQKNANYKAACDLSSTISCSKVFTSKWGKGFGLVEPLLGADHFLNVPNAVFGLLFYSLTLVFGGIRQSTIALLSLLASTASVAGSVYLGYILLLVLHDTCIVCISTYVLNFFCLLLAYYHYQSVSSPVSASQKARASTTKRGSSKFN